MTNVENFVSLLKRTFCGLFFWSKNDQKSEEKGRVAEQVRLEQISWFLEFGDKFSSYMYLCKDVQSNFNCNGNLTSRLKNETDSKPPHKTHYREVIAIYITDVKQLYIPRKLEIFCEHDRREGSLRFENFRGMLSWFSSVLYVVLYPDIFHSSSPYIFCIKVSKGLPHFILFRSIFCMFCCMFMI